MDYFTDHTFIFTDGSKDGDKTAAAFICPSSEFSNRIPDKAYFLTADLEEIVSVLRYIKSTTNIHTFVVSVTQNPHFRPCCTCRIIPLFKLL